MSFLDRFKDTKEYIALRKTAETVLPPRILYILKTIGYRLRASINTGRWDKFAMVGIETTTLCNQRCGYCPHADDEARRSKQKRGHQMPQTLFSNIIDQLQGFGFGGQITLNGYGEPLLDCLLVDRVREIREKLPRAYISINSNGAKLTAEKLQELIDVGLSHIDITNHHERGTGAYADLEQKIEGLRADPKFGRYIFYKEQIGKIYNRGGAVNAEALDQYVKVGYLAGPQDRLVCLSNMFTLTIAVDGAVLICCNDFDHREPMGKLGENGRESMEDIWCSEKFRRLRIEILRGDFRNRVCRRCNIGLHPVTPESESLRP